MGLGPDRGDDDERDGDHRQRPREDGRVIAAVRFRDARLEGPHLGHRQVAELIGESRQDCAHRGRGELVEMRRHDAPCALHHELHQEAAEREHDGGVRKGPQRDHRQRKCRGRHDGAPAAEAFGQRTEADSSRKCAEVHDDRDVARDRRGEAVLRLKEGRIQVLRAVRESVEAGHQQHEITQCREVVFRRAPQGCGRGTLRGDARHPGRGLRDAEADVQHQQRGRCADHEHAAPADVIERVGKYDRGEQIADHVAFLQHSGEQAAAPRRERLERERGPHAPLTAHRKSEQRAQREQSREVGREGGEELHRRVAGDVQHQDRAAAVALRQPAEYQSPERAARQREEDALGHRLHAGVELGADRPQAEDENEEVERIQRPACERGDERAALRAGEARKGSEHGGLRPPPRLLHRRRPDLARDLVL